jgi:hypothetical protein
MSLLMARCGRSRWQVDGQQKTGSGQPGRGGLYPQTTHTGNSSPVVDNREAAIGWSHL